MDAQAMHNEIRVMVAADVDDELVTAMQHLVTQLSSSAPTPRVQELREIVESECTTLLIARDHAQVNRIVGSLTHRRG